MQYLSVGTYPSKCTALGRDSKPRNIHSRQLGALDHRLAEAEDALPITLGALSVPRVTADKAVLKAFPDRALTMDAFIGR